MGREKPWNVPSVPGFPIYDSLNRIQQAYTTGTNWGETFAPTATAPGVTPAAPGIDAWGNLTNRSGVTGKTTYEGLNCSATNKNQLTCLSYDAAGNVIANGGATYTYDAENRLIAAGGYTYTYDGDGRRVKKCVSGTCSSGTVYWRDVPGDVIAESDLAGNWTASYVPWGGIPFVRVDLPANTLRYYFANQLGSTSVITDATGGIVKEADYYPYGGEIPVSGTDPNRYKFTGKERDIESGLDDFGDRYYASSVSRFMAADNPFNDQSENDAQSWNLYSYVRNNPLRFTDPTGDTCVKSSHGDWVDDGQGGETCAQVDQNNQQAQQHPDETNTTFVHDTFVTMREIEGVNAGMLGPGDLVLLSGVRTPGWLAEFFGKAFGPMLDKMSGSIIDRFAGSGIQRLGLEGAAELANVAEVKSLVAQAASTVGNQGVKASSRAIAEQAAKDWVGAGARNIVDRNTGTVVGEISADGSRIARFTSVSKPQPYINLVNKTGAGGNLHISF